MSNGKVTPAAESSGSTSADQAWFAERAPHWGDVDWWHAQIDAAIAGSDPVICNLRITLVHQELSLALNRVIGARSGANFHTWAVWGSKTAGRTIRREDLRFSPRANAALSALLASVGAVGLFRRKVSRQVGLLVMTGATVSGCLSWVVSDLVNRAASDIFGGNATVLDDIGRQSARFLGVLSRSPHAGGGSPLEDFLSELRPGPAVNGGQDLLRGAYRHYYAASRTTDRDRRDEIMLCANLLAILHEHERLDPYIDASVPHPLRRLVTKRLLSFSVGAEAMNVARDVATRGGSPFPDTLAKIEDSELDTLLSGPQGWDRTPNTTTGSAAEDWTKLSDRMNFIVDLFRSRQGDPDLFRPPYSFLQRELILSGRIPDGPL